MTFTDFSRLHVEGSSLFVGVGQGFAVVDPWNGSLRRRFVVPSAPSVSGIAVDRWGSKVWLATTTGVSEAELVSPPLAIGSVEPAAVPAAAPVSVTVRGSGFAEGVAIVTEGRVLAAQRFDPNGKLVKRLLAAYARATGRADPPAISGGGTYAKRIPNAIAFGMWFPGKPYPGHDVDEKVELGDLHLGVEVLLEALADLACGAPLKEPFKP